jgi:hypothetical protein
LPFESTRCTLAREAILNGTGEISALSLNPIKTPARLSSANFA